MPGAERERSPAHPPAAAGDPLASADLQAYAALLAGYRRANVTGARGSAAGVAELVGDALALLEVDELGAASAVVAGGQWADLGSGGGLPGIPLALALPGVRLTLIESVGKKCAFLQEAVARVGLGARVEVACARSEELAALGRPDRERFAVVLAKAVGPLAVVVELASPLLGLGGVLAVSKTAAAAASSPSRVRLFRVRCASCSRRWRPRPSAFRGGRAWRPSDRWPSAGQLAGTAVGGAGRGTRAASSPARLCGGAAGRSLR